MTEKRFKRSTRVAAAWGGFLVSVALAFFMATYLGDGSHEGTTGEGIEEALPVLVNFEDGVTPTNPVEVSAALENTSSETINFTSWTMDVETPSFPKCGNEWLTITAKGSASGANLTWWQETIEGAVRTSVGEFAPGTRDVLAKESEGSPTGREGANVTLWLEFEPGPAGTTNQEACESVPVVVNSSLRE